MANFQLTLLLPESEFAIPATLKEEELSCPDLILYYCETWQNCYPQDLIRDASVFEETIQHIWSQTQTFFVADRWRSNTVRNIWPWQVHI